MVPLVLRMKLVKLEHSSPFSGAEVPFAFSALVRLVLSSSMMAALRKKQSWKLGEPSSSFCSGLFNKFTM